MKKIISVILLLMLAACGQKPQMVSMPVVQPTTPTQQTTQQVLVCNAEVKKGQLEIDKAAPGLPLEQQNAAIRTSLAQLKAYTVDLEAGFVQCGGKIKR